MARDRNMLPWLLAALGGAVALAFTQRKTIMIYGAKALEAGKELLFQASLSNEAQPYSDLILQVAREQNVDPFLIYALGQRESRWGAALSPPGPAGTGDYGHGRGIMQIDDRSWGDWLNSNDWGDAYTNVSKGAEILKAKIAFFAGKSAVSGLTDGSTVSVSANQAAKRGVSPGSYPDPRPLSGEALTQAGIAAYNAGEGAVLVSLAVGLEPEATTYGGDYVTWVWNKMTEAANAFSA